MVSVLIESGAGINAVDACEGVAPLHTAAKLGHVAIVDFLTANGANVKQADKKGQAPLHIAALVGHVAIVKLLIKEGTGVGTVDVDMDVHRCTVRLRRGTSIF